MGAVTRVAALVVVCLTWTNAQDSASYYPFQTCSQSSSDAASGVIRAAFSSLAAADCALANPMGYPPHYSPADGERFDFIVVGAGSAGAVVANRLSEEHGWRVLLVEAGDDPTKTTEVPSMAGALQGSELDWQYHTDYSKVSCLGFRGNRCRWPRGKVLGGSSSINFNLYVRGNARDFDGWAEDGNTGWAYDDVLPYFKKSEDMRASEVLGGDEFSKYHSTGGLLKVEHWDDEDVLPLANDLAEGMAELGYLANQDVNGRNQSGFVKMQGTLQERRRCSTARAFLSSAVDRSNLKVAKRSLVTKVVIDPKTLTARGVEFIDRNGRTINVEAEKEVILSAGAINSPQLLLLSGVGPRRHLEEMNIPVLRDLPVGQNLQDHQLLHGLVLSLDFQAPELAPEEQMVQFLLKRPSKYSNFGMGSFVGFITTEGNVDHPDVELLLLDFHQNDTVGLPGYLEKQGVRKEIQEKYFAINKDSHVILTLGSLLRPSSRGSVRLMSKDPKDQPQITSGYLTDARDVETFIRFHEFLEKLVDTRKLKELGAKLHVIDIPECEKYRSEVKKYRNCLQRFMVSTTYHPCCTAAMGPRDSVVDPQLRVRGVKNLRVVDASVMPREVGGNLNAVVIMIGEKGADLVKEAWGRGEQPQRLLNRRRPGPPTIRRG